MSAVSISNLARAEVIIRQWARNGTAPVADLENKLAETLGHWAKFRAKQVFVRSSPIESVPASAGSSRARWRFAFHSGPYAKFMAVRMELAPQDNGTPTYPYSSVQIALASAPTVAVGRADISFGRSDGDFIEAPSSHGGNVRTLNLSTDESVLSWLLPHTEYVGTFYDYDYARLMSAVLWEVSIEPNTDAGYAPTSLSVGSPITDIDRQTLDTMARALWSHTALPLWHQCCETDATARTVIADDDYRNFVDGTTTPSGPDTPGQTIDLEYRTTISRINDGVPVRFKAYASATVASTWTVDLIDDTATVVLSIPITGTTAAWYEVDGFLAASLQRYDIAYGGGATGTLSLIATSLYEIYQDGPGDIPIDYSLSFTATGDPDPVDPSTAVTFEIDAVVGGATQTDLTISVRLIWYGGATRPGATPTVSDADGWTAGSWSTAGVDVWDVTLTRASHTVSTSTIVIGTSSGETGGMLECELLSGASTQSPFPSMTGDTLTIEEPFSGSYTIEKTSGTADVYNAGASSTETYAGDCRVETTIGQTQKGRAIGYSTSDPDQNFSTIARGVLFTEDVTPAAYYISAGSFTYISTYALTDVWAVTRDGSNVVRIERNGSVVHTDGTTLTGSLLIDTALYSANATLEVVTAYDNGVIEPVTWQNSVNVTIT